jgi:hypothetical protein
MEKVEAYRKHAEECRTLAERARSPDEREMLLNMAKTGRCLRRLAWRNFPNSSA